MPYVETFRAAGIDLQTKDINDHRKDRRTSLARKRHTTLSAQAGTPFQDAESQSRSWELSLAHRLPPALGQPAYIASLSHKQRGSLHDTIHYSR
jgi:hypothetical protein